MGWGFVWVGNDLKDVEMVVNVVFNEGIDE